MSAKDLILEVITSSKPAFKDDDEKLVFAVHAAFIKSGFILTATGPLSQTNFYSPCRDEVSIDGWNKNRDCYSFVYSLPEWGKLLVRCLPMRDHLMINILAAGISEPIHFDISTSSYVCNTESSEYNKQFSDLDKLGRKFDMEISRRLPWEVSRPFHQKNLDVAFLGLRKVGKTSLLKVVDTGEYVEDVHPMDWPWNYVFKGNIKLSVLDENDEEGFVNEYKFVYSDSVIVYVVDAADPDNISRSRDALFKLLRKNPSYRRPLLVVGNKIDKHGALSEQAFTDQMDLKSITDREVYCFMISCKTQTNIDLVINWVSSHAEYDYE